MTVSPKFRHDSCCGNETFVGHFRDRDIYWCNAQGQWIVRDGNEPENYSSCKGMTLDALMIIPENTPAPQSFDDWYKEN